MPKFFELDKTFYLFAGSLGASILAILINELENSPMVEALRAFYT